MLHFFLQLCEGLLGLSTVYIQKENMIEAKKLMTRALELATYVLGVKHHFVAAIFTRVRNIPSNNKPFKKTIHSLLEYHVRHKKENPEIKGTVVVVIIWQLDL